MSQINNTIVSKKSKTKTSLFCKLKQFSFSSFIISITIITIMVLILVNPSRYAISVTNGIELFYTAILPGLLPFMFLCKLLTESNIFNKIATKLSPLSQKFFGINGYGAYAFFMSIISGYPLGSKITADLYNTHLISDKELTKTAIISSSSGLEFIIGAVGGLMLKSIYAGVIIYISNILAVIITSLFMNLFCKKEPKTRIFEQVQKEFIPPKEQPQKKQLINIITKSAIDTASSLLVVCFYISLFSLIIDLLKDTNIISLISSPINKLTNNNFQNITNGAISGLVEMTNGIKQLSTTLSPLSISLISMLISFSGLSIILQSFSFLSNTPLNKPLFILGKILQMIFSFTICFVLCYIL